MARRSYHHGNLRQALVDAAVDLIAEAGAQGLTMAEAAKRADVSAAAPYRHFAGREDLLIEVAHQGYDLFTDLLEQAYQNGQPSPLEAFSAMGRAYLAFARKHPGHYAAMFESGIDPSANRALSAACARSSHVLMRAADDLSQHLPVDRRPPASMFAAHVTAMSHGVVALYARNAPGTRTPFTPEDLLESGIGVYLRGLGLVGPDA